MQTFNYAAIRPDNSYIRGKIKTRSRKQAVKALQRDGLLVINLKKELKAGWQNLVIYGRISRIDRIYFTRHLHAYLEAGVALNQAIRIAAEQVTNQKFKEILYDIHERIVAGQSLYGSLNQHAKYFSSYFINLIKVGEESGKLDIILEHLLEQQEKEHELITKVRGALIYPAVIILAAVAVVIFMMTFVVPTIAGLLADYGAELPLPTRVLIATSNLVMNHGIIIAGLSAALVVALRLLVKTPKGKRLFESLLFKIPLVKKIVLEYNIARFTRAMSAPLQSGLGIDQSLELALSTSENIHFKETIENSLTLVRKGVPLSEILIGYPKLYPPSVTRMIEIGEQTGKIDEMFSRLASFYEKSVFNTFNNLSSVIEPFLLIGIGLVVGFIAVSILTPIWQFAETI